MRDIETVAMDMASDICIFEVVAGKAQEDPAEAKELLEHFEHLQEKLPKLYDHMVSSLAAMRPRTRYTDGEKIPESLEKFTSLEAKESLLQEDRDERLRNAVFLQKIIENGMEQFPELEFPEFDAGQGTYSDFHVALMSLSMRPGAPDLHGFTKMFIEAATDKKNALAESREVVDWVMYNFFRSIEYMESLGEHPRRPRTPDPKYRHGLD